ncbi:hypothetical protein GCM10027290_29010 [Micromonospora sonneratiae]|uniref:non-specific serine/threonine protein kinase n=1 Tax=Micromonospora sonneratiae TaxID=1184706 RepID=A0ABW3Y8R9_9ACTN
MPASPPTGPSLTGYRILDRIRRGPEATVYHAIREADETPVALKVLRVEPTVGLSTELGRLRHLPRHPHIVQVLDTGRTDDGRPFLAMPYYPDGSYAELLAGGGPVSVAEAVRVGIAVASALQATHDAGVIHRDVTPGNILRGPDGPVLTDFGIAAVPDELAGTVALDRLTPPHASPEALLRQPQDARSDIYGLASTLWTLLAGHPPFAAPGDPSPDPFAYRDDALHLPAPSVPREDVPGWLQAALLRALTKEPAGRYPNASDFGAALLDRSEPWPGEGSSPTGQPARPQSAGSDSPHRDDPTTGLVIEIPAPGSAPTGGTTDGAGVRPSGSAPRAADRPTTAGSPDASTAATAGSPPTATDAQSVPGAEGKHTEVVDPAPVHPSPTQPPTAAVAGPEPDERWARPVTAPDGPPDAQHHPDIDPPEPAVEPAPHPVPGFGPAVASEPAPSVPAGSAAPTGRRPLRLVAIGVTAAVIGMSSVFLTALLRPDGQSPAATPTPPPPAATVVTLAAPQDVRLDDERIAVTLTWRDPSGGQAAFYVVGGPAGREPDNLANAPRGATSVRVNGLNPTVEYCFIVVAVLSVDEVAHSGEICTRRSVTATTGPTPSPTD